MLGRESAYDCHNLRTEKEGICSKYSEYKTSNWHTSDFHVGKWALKVHVLGNHDHFLAANLSFLNPC